MFNRFHLFLSVTVFFAGLVIPITSVSADTCLKARARTNKSGRVRVSLKSKVVASGASCGKGFTKADGSKIYGDGSAGERIVTGDTTLSEVNTQFANFTVNTGVTLSVESGTIIRCTGTFTNNGTIEVKTHAGGGKWQGFSSSHLDMSRVIPAPGIAGSIAGFGEIGDKTTDVLKGTGAEGMTEAKAKQMLRPGPLGGGGGGIGIGNTSGTAGGGTLTVICSGPVTNSGTISADGESGDGTFITSGGSGGGVVILTSATSISNAGTVTANGGDGSPSISSEGAGGGGGGGIVHFIAPSIPSTGTVQVSGGSAGDNSTDADAALVGGGAGGGAGAGAGGDGGGVQFNDTAGAAEDGDDGFSFTTTLDPAGLLM